ncbi:MAG: RES domain-containing protein [Gammaproteobacteria bacterium]|nr:MAG: RES domain-containing protein [Gammaproteobacteria bacterium]RTZ81607.1 MAG: RES domain-containing protein [Gammaproteobacteria bacterium]
MSLWEGCGGTALVTAVDGRLWRLVESQEETATMSFVDTLDEQALLESLLEDSKPPSLPGSEELHYLLKTPFRYPPLRWGSRFGRPHELGIFYGGLSVTTTLAESAYYRFLFWHSMAGEPPAPRIQSEHSLFSVRYATGQGIRLQEPPCDVHRNLIAHPADYRATQVLGSTMREAGVQAFEYPSARDPKGGTCAGLFTPQALASRKPANLEPWWCELSTGEVLFKTRERKPIHRFHLDDFLYRGKLPLPAN